MFRIAHLIYDNPANPWVAGGGAIRNIEIYSRFKKDIQTDIFSGDYKDSSEKDYAPNTRQKFLGRKSLFYPESRLFYSIAAYNFVKKNRRQYDLFVEDYSPFSPTGIRSLLPPRAYICQTQNYFGLSNHLKKIGPAGFLTSLMEKQHYRKCPRIIFSSEDLRRMIVSGTGIDPDQKETIVIPYGVSDELLNSRKNFKKKQQILFLGRLEIHQKGIDSLLSFLSAMDFPKLGLFLVIAGSGKDEKKVRILVKRHGLSARTHFTGRITGPEKTRLISESLFTVIPSRYESWGLVSLESQACGTPVLAAGIPGLRQTLLNGRTGLLFHDFETFKSSFMKLFLDQRGLKKMSVACRKFAQSYSWDKLVKEQMSFYTRTLNKG